MPIDYHVHSIGHEDREHTKSNVRAFLEQAKRIGLQEIGFADHDLYLGQLNLHLYEKLAAEYPDLKVRVGLEVDYFPGKEYELKEMITGSFAYDYTIGSVHYLNDWMFDHPETIEAYRSQNPEALYRKYFSLLLNCVKSGLFRIIGHLDLIKIFNARVGEDCLLSLVEPILKVAKLNEMAMEVNTNGLYKPVKELYPSKSIIKLAIEMGVPLTIASDAHQAEDVGRDNKMVVALLKDFGCEAVVGFDKGKLREVLID